jgi:hypothetical protein
MNDFFKAIRFTAGRISKRRDTFGYSALFTLSAVAALTICAPLTAALTASALVLGREFGRYAAWTSGPHHQAPAGCPNTFPTREQTAITLSITTFIAAVPISTVGNFWLWQSRGIPTAIGTPFGFGVSSICVAAQASETGPAFGEIRKAVSDYRRYFFDYYAKNDLDQGPGFFEALGDQVRRSIGSPGQAIPALIPVPR